MASFKLTEQFLKDLEKKVAIRQEEKNLMNLLKFYKDCGKESLLAFLGSIIK